MGVVLCKCGATLSMVCTVLRALVCSGLCCILLYCIMVIKLTLLEQIIFLFLFA